MRSSLHLMLKTIPACFTTTAMTYLVQGKASLHHEDEDGAHEYEEDVDAFSQILDRY